MHYKPSLTGEPSGKTQSSAVSQGLVCRTRTARMSVTFDENGKPYIIVRWARRICSCACSLAVLVLLCARRRSRAMLRCLLLHEGMRRHATAARQKGREGATMARFSFQSRVREPRMASLRMGDYPCVVLRAVVLRTPATAVLLIGSPLTAGRRRRSA